MTWKEALRELGIASAADKAAVRKAYLRVLKTRSPERDPEGFMRLREAYEMVSRAAVSAAFVEAVKAERSARAPSDGGEERAAKKPAAEPAVAPAKVEKARPSDKADGGKTDTDQANPKDTDQANPKDTDQANPKDTDQANPKDTDRTDADQTAADQKDTDQKDTDQKDADQKDADQKDTDQKDTDQKDADQKDADQKDADQKDTDHDDEADEPESRSSGTEDPQIAVSRAAADPSQASRNLAILLLDHFAAREAQGQATTDLLPQGVATLLTMIEAGMWDLAWPLAIALDHAARGSANPLKAFRGSARWILTSELWAVRDWLPLDLFPPLAHAIRENDFEYARWYFWARAGAEPHRFDWVGWAIMKGAPTLGKTLRITARPALPVPKQASKAQVNGFFGALLALMIIGGIVQAINEPERPSRSTTVQPTHAPPAKSTWKAPPPPPSASAKAVPAPSASQVRKAPEK